MAGELLSAGDGAAANGAVGWGGTRTAHHVDRTTAVAIDDLLTKAAKGTLPFVFLDDQRNGAATLFTKPRRIFRADTEDSDVRRDR